MAHGGLNPVRQGGAAFAAMGEHSRVVPTLVVHGTADLVVSPVNRDQTVWQ